MVESGGIDKRVTILRVYLYLTFISSFVFFHLSNRLIFGTSVMRTQCDNEFKYLHERLQNNGLRLPVTDDILTKSNINNLPKLNLSSIKARSVVKIKWKFHEKMRSKFICHGPSSIWQGSHTVELPLLLLTYLSRLQVGLHINGTIGEIGVHGGLFFIGLAHLAIGNENLWACDVFEQQSKNVDGSGFGVKSYFLKKCGEFGIVADEIDLFVGSSIELPIHFRQGTERFRLISVDGGHTRQITFNDLTIAAENLSPGGIIILDDVTNYNWPGVIDGMLSWLLVYHREFAPFFVGHNKVFLAERQYHGFYYRALMDNPYFAKMLSNNPNSNSNPHKSNLSGKNSFGWGGYSYLTLVFLVYMQHLILQDIVSMLNRIFAHTLRLRGFLSHVERFHSEGDKFD